jgi:hypothetical protein
MQIGETNAERINVRVSLKQSDCDFFGVSPAKVRHQSSVLEPGASGSVRSNAWSRGGLRIIRDFYLVAPNERMTSFAMISPRVDLSTLTLRIRFLSRRD